MISSSDWRYKQTRKIKRGKATLKPEFRELAEWINETYHVHTLNIIYDTMDNGKRPRLEICVEFESDERKLRGRSWFNLDSEKQSAIAEKFKQTFQGETLKKTYLTENTWVYYRNFESIVKDEENESIPEEKIMELKNSIHNNDLWEISRFGSRVTFFVFTEKQVEKYKESEVRKEWASQYFDLLEPYNEFGYFRRKKFSIRLDSKENFDNKYGSSWFNYYR
ncbi:MAG: hypothetical protein FWH27_16105 [Planctomycetaceae bacterium]|nr:hypothetical protein [Planctomycetaceae bacterium]